MDERTKEIMFKASIVAMNADHVVFEKLQLERFAELVRQDEREQAEKQEPVAWMLDFIDDGFEVKDFVVTKPKYIGAGYNVRPLYTAPPRKEWVGLNWDDIPDVFVGDIAFMQGAKWALAKLKEKNT